VIVVGGLAGSGKTTLATALAEAIGAEHMRTDVVRHELFGSRPNAVEKDAGIYSPMARRRVYVTMFERAAVINADRISVVLDGTFSAADAMSGAEKTAADPRSLLFAVECACSPQVAHARIARRLKEGHDASEARPEIHDLQRRRWQSWPADIPQVRVDTEQPLRTQVEHVIGALAGKHWF